MRKAERFFGWSRRAAITAIVGLLSCLVVSSPQAAPAAAGETKAAATKPAEKLDINAASKTDLAKLPGIGEVYSQKIIDGRPYKSKAELESKKILPKGVYEKIAPLIIAHQK